MAKLSALILVSAAALSVAHLCILEPLQRGGAAGAGSSGANACFQTAGPCGVTMAGSPTAAYLAGTQAYATLMKNLDHYSAGTPGNFSVYLWNAAGQSQLLSATPDTPAPRWVAPLMPAPVASMRRSLAGAPPPASQPDAVLPASECAGGHPQWQLHAAGGVHD